MIAETTQCTAAVAREANGAFTIETLTLEPPRAGEVLVRIAGVGLCHTDLIFRDQFTPYPLPAVLGHEGSGTIAAIGEGVEGLAVGDKVVLGFSSCGACVRCDEGLPSYCRSFVPLNYIGMRPDDATTALAGAEDERVSSFFFGQSSFASHAITRARNVVKVESAAPIELLGPLGCGLQTGAGGVIRSLAATAGSTIAVLGGGPVGLAAVMGAGIQQCATIVLVEPIAARRELAMELGATHVIDPAAGDVAAALLAICPDGFDFAFDSTGMASVIEAGIAALGGRGAIGLVGVPKSIETTIAVNITALMGGGRRIIGITEGDSDPVSFIPELLAHHAAGRFPFDRLIRTYPLAQINEAIAAQARGECVKVVLLP